MNQFLKWLNLWWANGPNWFRLLILVTCLPAGLLLWALDGWGNGRTWVVGDDAWRAVCKPRGEWT